MRVVKNKQTGFTIVELLIVVVVIAILAAITIVAYNGITARSKDSVARADLASAYKKLESLKIADAAQTYPLTQTAAGLSGSGGTTFSYVARSAGAGYCARSSYDAVAYFVTSSVSSVTRGSCEFLSMWLPGSGGESSGYAYPVTLSQATSGTGVNTSAYTFNGSQRIVVGSNSSIQLSGGSISLWVNPTSTNGNLITAGAPGASGAVANISSLFVRLNNGVVNAGWTDGPVTTPDYDQAISNASLAIGQWHHLVLSWRTSPSNVRLYVNGVAQSAQDVFSNNNKTDWEDQLTVGGTSAGGNFSGSIDDLRIFNQVLTDDEVTALYGQGAV